MDMRIKTYEQEIRARAINEFVEKVVEEVARRDTTDGTVKVFTGMEVLEIVRGAVRNE